MQCSKETDRVTDTQQVAATAAAAAAVVAAVDFSSGSHTYYAAAAQQRQQRQQQHYSDHNNCTHTWGCPRSLSLATSRAGSAVTGQPFDLALTVCLPLAYQN
jgi:hypothetical protein